MNEFKSGKGLPEIEELIQIADKIEINPNIIPNN